MAHVWISLGHSDADCTGRNSSIVGVGRSSSLHFALLNEPVNDGLVDDLSRRIEDVEKQIISREAGDKESSVSLEARLNLACRKVEEYGEVIGRHDKTSSAISVKLQTLLKWKTSVDAQLRSGTSVKGGGGEGGEGGVVHGKAQVASGGMGGNREGGIAGVVAAARVSHSNSHMVDGEDMMESIRSAVREEMNRMGLGRGEVERAESLGRLRGSPKDKERVEDGLGGVQASSLCARCEGGLRDAFAEMKSDGDEAERREREAGNGVAARPNRMAGALSRGQGDAGVVGGGGKSAGDGAGAGGGGGGASGEAASARMIVEVEGIRAKVDGWEREQKHMQESVRAAMHRANLSSESFSKAAKHMSSRIDALERLALDYDRDTCAYNQLVSIQRQGNIVLDPSVLDYGTASTNQGRGGDDVSRHPRRASPDADLVRAPYGRGLHQHRPPTERRKSGNCSIAGGRLIKGPAHGDRHQSQENLVSRSSTRPSSARDASGIRSSPAPAVCRPLSASAAANRPGSASTSRHTQSASAARQQQEGSTTMIPRPSCKGVRGGDVLKPPVFPLGVPAREELAWSHLLLRNK